MLTITAKDKYFLDRAFDLAAMAAEAGNYPIGSVIVFNDEIVSEGMNQVYVPNEDPGRHAEIVALEKLPSDLKKSGEELMCFSTLEPCYMCLSTLVRYHFSRVVFASNDPVTGGGKLMQVFRTIYPDSSRLPSFEGPLDRSRGDSLYQQTLLAQNLKR